MAFFGLITNNQIYNAIQALQVQLNKIGNQILMSESQTQSDIDNAVTVISGFLTDVQSKNAEVLSDIQEIQQALANGQTVDTSKLDSMVATVSGIQTNLDSAVSQLSSVANPAPAPSPAPPAS